MKFTISRTEEPDGNWFKVRADEWTEACFRFDPETETTKYVEALIYFDILIKAYKVNKTLIVKSEEV